ncbi:MAG: hypothetical protein HY537_13170 [Deltaproteobacteria bacterium]|nr:hypothetical protein [Deltaproteobacteria bacterium]
MWKWKLFVPFLVLASQLIGSIIQASEYPEAAVIETSTHAGAGRCLMTDVHRSRLFEAKQAVGRAKKKIQEFVSEFKQADNYLIPRDGFFRKGAQIGAGDASFLINTGNALVLAENILDGYSLRQDLKEDIETLRSKDVSLPLLSTPNFWLSRDQEGKNIDKLFSDTLFWLESLRFVGTYVETYVPTLGDQSISHDNRRLMVIARAVQSLGQDTFFTLSFLTLSIDQGTLYGFLSDSHQANARKLANILHSSPGTLAEKGNAIEAVESILDRFAGLYRNGIKASPISTGFEFK